MTAPIEGYRLSPQQRRIWELMTDGRPESYAVSCTIDITGPCEPESLCAALERLARRHEILRTTFRRPPGVDVPLQVIAQDVSRVGFEVHDLGGLTAQEQREQLAALAGECRTALPDLENGPVLSAALIRSDGSRGGQARLLLRLPALCADEASLRILVGELVSDLSGGTAPTQEPLQYADFAQWQLDLLTDPDFEPEREYWLGRNPAYLTCPQLPFGAAGGYRPAFRPAVERRRLPENLRAALRDLARLLEVALATVVLAAWRVLLGRMADGQWFAVGVRFDNREAEELRSAAGLLAQYLPAVSAPEPGEGLVGFVRRLQDELDQMGQVQAYFEREQGESRPSPIADGSFGAGFDWRDGDGHIVAHGPGRFRLGIVDAVTERFQVRLSGRDEQDSLWLDMWHDAESVDPAQARLLIGQLVAILQAIAANPKAPMHALAAVEADANDGAPPRARIAVTETAAIPVHLCFAQAARRWPDRVAARCGERVLTYGALDAQANRLARHLRKLGVAADRPVVVCLRRSVSQLVAMMGVLKAGGAFVMVDPSSPRERRARMLAAAAAQVVVTTGELAGSLADLSPAVIALDDDAETIAAESAAELDDPAISDDRLAYLVFTSGSTGTPKAVAVSHRNLAEYARGVQDLLRLPSGVAFGLVSSLAVDLGYTSVFPALCSGGIVQVVPEDCVTDPLELARHFRQSPVDCLKITPPHLRALLEGGDSASVLPARVLVIGGEQLDPELVRRIRQAAPLCRIVNHYGPAETTVGVLACETEADEAAGPGSVPLGWEFGGARVHLLDDRLRSAPVWVQGEIYVGGLAVCRGYAGLPSATAERFVADPYGPAGSRLYRTGDRARRLPGGALRFEGRVDDQLKIRGYRVEPAEVAAVLRGHPLVHEAVVLGVSDRNDAVRLAAYGVWEGAAEQDLRDFCASQLPSYLVPSVFTAVERLPMTVGGKVDRRALPTPAIDAVRGAVFEEPQGPVEELLADVWAQALGLPQVGRQDDFFALGGDSIVSIQVVARAAHLGLRLTPRMLFRHRTIAEVAPHARATSGAPIAEQDAVRGPVPMTPILRWFAEQMLPWVRHYNQAVWLRIPGAADQEALRTALREMAVHHDALRLRLTADEGGGWVVDNAGPDLVEQAHSLLSVIDCSGLAPDARDLRLAELAAEVQASMDLESGCLLRAALVRLPDEDRLLLAVHHLGVDGVSWRILLEDLVAGYGQALDGRTVRFPAKTTSFRAWARRLEAYAQAPELLLEVDRWKAVITGPGLTVPLDTGADLSHNTHGGAATVTGSLRPEQTDALLRPRSTSVATFDLLLGALARTLADWTGQQRVVLDLEGHGRESQWDDMDVSRTVGWFTCQYPFALDIDPGEDAWDIARRVHMTLASVPQGGLGYGLVRYSRQDRDEHAAGLRALPDPQVRFNYLGQVTATDADRGDVVADPGRAAFTLVQGGTGPTADPRARRPYLLDVVAIVVDGRLQVSWIHCPQLHRQATIESLSSGLLDRLRELCAEQPTPGGLRPEDFPLASLDHAQLAAIEALLED